MQHSMMEWTRFLSEVQFWTREFAKATCQQTVWVMHLSEGAANQRRLPGWSRKKLHALHSGEDEPTGGTCGDVDVQVN